MARKPKNPELPGVEGPGVTPVRIKSIDRLAADYVEVRDERMELTQREVKAKRALAAEMHKHEDVLRHPDGVMRYDYDGTLVMISPVMEKLTVKSPSSASSDGSDD